jgi:hypothetical protein
MPIFKLRKNDGTVENACLVEASKTNLDLEKHLECWLENSPWAIAQEPFLWIGRQTIASDDNSTFYPDLLGIDKDGNIVVVELKKGRAPREVVAQLLEYAAWVSELSEDAIIEMAEFYFSKIGKKENNFNKAFLDIFEADEVPHLNQSQRLFVAAEEIPSAISRVCRFLRTSHGVDVQCVEFSVFQTESGEILVSSESVVGQEDVIPPKKSIKDRWTGEKPVKQVVWEAAQELTAGDKGYIFSPKDVCEIILKKYPNFNKTTIRCQIISDCVGHTSRHHYPGGEDRYWNVEKGKYRLFDPEKDQSPESAG